jgi:hypothetical protein
MNAFFQCTGLRSITLPDSLQELPIDAFEECENLTIHCSETTYQRLLKGKNFGPGVCMVTTEEGRPAKERNWYYPAENFEFKYENCEGFPAPARIARASQYDDTRWLYLKNRFDRDFQALNGKEKSAYINKHYPRVRPIDAVKICPEGTGSILSIIGQIGHTAIFQTARALPSSGKRPERSAK